MQIESSLTQANKHSNIQYLNLTSIMNIDKTETDMLTIYVDLSRSSLDDDTRDNIVLGGEIWYN
ncbi:hypothetical protein KZY59_11435 [Prevotella buccae]|nr:hypothetical protein HMPREF1146_1214 [Prevotella sp. MSX73]MBW4872144.1 hypothetical protein [Segatella buccae]